MINMEVFMAEKKHETKNKHAIILGILGVIFVIIGAGIAIIHNPLRGSGLGTACIVLGVVLLVISIIRFSHSK
jgi:hypothetical protein